MLNCLICPFLRGISKGGLKGKFTLYAFIVTNEVILCLYLLWLIQLFCVCICIPNHAGEWLCWCWGAWRELLDVIHSPNDEGAWGALVLRCMTWVVLWGTYLTMQVRDWRALVLRGSDAEVRGVSGFLGYIPNDAGAWSALMLKCMTWVVSMLGYIPNDAGAWSALMLKCMTWVVSWGTYLMMQVREVLWCWSAWREWFQCWATYLTTPVRCVMLRSTLGLRLWHWIYTEKVTHARQKSTRCLPVGPLSSQPRPHLLHPPALIISSVLIVGEVVSAVYTWPCTFSLHCPRISGQELWLQRSAETIRVW